MTFICKMIVLLICLLNVCVYTHRAVLLSALARDPLALGRKEWYGA